MKSSKGGFRMSLRNVMLACAALAMAGCAMAPSKTANAPTVRTQDIEAAAQAFSQKTGIANMSLLMMRGETVLYRKDFGAYTPETVVPIASATKWMVGATVMKLVDEGKLTLDAPIRTWLTDLPSPHADLTLAQLLSYTSGTVGLNQGGADVRQDKTITLAAAVKELAKLPLAAGPGTSFAYGGTDFQFVGAVVEATTGEPWAKVFDERIGAPLGMTPVYWSNPRGPNPPETVRNPLLQGGAATSMDAYAPLLTMLAQEGVFKGKRILSVAAVREMEKTMTRGLEMRFVPPGAPAGAQYSIAHWCEVEGPKRCVMLSSPGAFGAYPWIDRANGLHGVIFLQDQFSRIAADERVLRDAMIAAAR
jgi:CubicO group peptidase (beta-lactamase class C family)